MEAAREIGVQPWMGERRQNFTPQQIEHRELIGQLRRERAAAGQHRKALAAAKAAAVAEAEQQRGRA